jgi:hypothetical protein
MSSNPSATHSLESPLAQLERGFIEDFVRSHGYDPLKLAELPAEERERLLKGASIYASGKLVEVEARAHYLDDIHDGSVSPHKPGLD